MKILKLALISILFFLALLWLFSLLIPSEVRISRAINLAKTAEGSARKLVGDTSNWQVWNPMFRRDSASVGYQIEAVKDPSREFRHKIHTQGRSFLSEFQFISYPAGDSITLQWYAIFNLKPLPWERFESLLYEDTYGEVMQRGLQNLKASAK